MSARVWRPYTCGSRVPSRLRLGPCKTRMVRAMLVSGKDHDVFLGQKGVFVHEIRSFCSVLREQALNDLREFVGLDLAEYGLGDTAFCVIHHRERQASGTVSHRAHALDAAVADH